MDANARVIRGVNIATVVFSGLQILFALFLIIMLGMSTSMLTNPDFINDVIHEIESSGSAFDDDPYYGGYDYDYSGMSQSEAEALVSMGISTIMVMGVGYLLCKIVALVAGIWALRNINNPAKFGSMFGFAIAAIVVSVLTGAFISGALFVVSAVYISRMRRMYAYAQQGYGQVLYGYAQPGQPPMQPNQPMQPGQQGQSMQPNQPMQPGQPSYGYNQQPRQAGQGSSAYQAPQNQLPQQLPPQQPLPSQQQQASPAPSPQQPVPQQSSEPVSSQPQSAPVPPQQSVSPDSAPQQSAADESSDAPQSASDAHNSKE